MGAPGPVILMDMIRRERLRRAAEGSLVEFIRQAWPVIEPGVEFRDNWHLHAMADHLEALTHGEIDNLILNIPPGCMKSLLTSVAVAGVGVAGESLVAVHVRLLRLGSLDPGHAKNPRHPALGVVPVQLARHPHQAG